MPPGRVLPLVTTCLADEREYVQNAVGWLLRELGHAYPVEVRAYLEKHIATISAVAFRRAIERRSPGVKAELRALREAALA
jgi:3-methyladenine DNA glycosylase AlkD